MNFIKAQLVSPGGRLGKNNRHADHQEEGHRPDRYRGTGHRRCRPRAVPPRQALVLKVGESAGATWVQVAYGTSQKVDKLYSGEFAITPSDGDAYSISGLSYPTKFNLASTFELPFNADWFEVPPGAPHGQVPKLGVLHPSLMRRARAPMEAAK